MDEWTPDVFVIPSYSLNEPIIRRIAESPEMCVVLIGSNYGDMDKGIDSDKFPILKITDEEKRLVTNLKQVCPKSGIVVCNYTGQYLEGCMGNWRNLGYEPKCLMNAADIITYMGGEVKPQYECDIQMISGKWSYKSQNLDKFFIPLCYPVGRYNIKIWGWGWNLVPQYLGQIDENEVKHVFKSSKITVNIHEPHSTVFGIEQTERAYKALVGGSMVISDYVKTIEEDIFTNEEVPMAKTPAQLEELIQYYLKDEDARLIKAEQGRQTTLDKHTYHDRVSSLFGYLGMPDESSKTIKKKMEILDNGKVQKL